MRDIRTANHENGQKIEATDVLKRIGDLTYRTLGVLSKMALFDTGKALIVGDGLRVETSSGMTVNVPAGACFQRLQSSLDVLPCLQIADQTITLDAATGAPRIDTIEAQIQTVTDKTDFTQIASGGVSSVVVTNDSIERDIKYFLKVQKVTGLSTTTAATAGSVTGTVDLSGTIDLSTQYLINISDGEDGSYQEVDCRGATPSLTTRAEIITALNTATGRTIASVSGNFIKMTGSGLGETSQFSFKPPATDASVDALEAILGISIGGVYKYTYSGENEWFKLAEIDVGAATTTITSDLIRNVDKKYSWASEGDEVFLNIPVFNKVSPTTITTDSTLVSGTINYINSTARLNLTLPVLAGQNETIQIIDIGGGGYTILQNAGQNILYMNQSTIPGTVGKIWSKTGYSSIKLMCTVENTTFQAIEIRDQYTMKGYLMGGDLGFLGAATDVIEDINFSTETSATITAVLSDSTKYGCGVSGSLKGYCMGGSRAAITDVIDGMTFQTEINSAISATLDTAKYGGMGVSGSLKGYYMGGYTGAVTAVIEDMNFSTESSAAIAATLDTAKKYLSSEKHSKKGYCMGGLDGASSPVAVIEDMNFSTESSATIVATLDTAKNSVCGVSGSLKGYCMGGFTVAIVAVIEDMNFSTESSAAIAATLDTAKRNANGVSGSLKGYCMGGYTGAVTAVIEDMNFSTESSAAIAATLDTAKNNGCVVQGYN